MNNNAVTSITTFKPPFMVSGEDFFNYEIEKDFGDDLDAAIAFRDRVNEEGGWVSVTDALGREV